MRCPRCDSAVGDGGRFCSRCGAAVAPAERVTTQERRQVTVLFYDLADSTRLSQVADPEDFSEALAAFHQRVETEVAALGGAPGARLGDGAIVYFGYPEACEDAPERAVLAGLRAVAAASDVLLPDGERAVARIGVATGPAVLSKTGRGRGNEVVGATAHLAARLQAAAPPGGVVVAETTRRLLGDLFQLEALAPLNVKGFAETVQAWRVVGGSDADRFQALRPGAATPLVGRDAELDRLGAVWRRAHSGVGETAFVTGEPGVGKSRLAAAFVAGLDAREAATLRFYCAPHAQNAPLWPIADQLRRMCGIEPGDPADTRRRKLAAALAPDTAPDDAALLGALIGAPLKADSFLSALEPARRLERMLAAMGWQVQALARRRPVVVLFEDVQWADATSLSLMDAFQRGALPGRILLLATARPEFRPGWAREARVASITLAPLQAVESEALVAQVAGGESLPAAVRRRILERADGVPLFLEEITRAVVEARSAGPGTARVEVPASLQDSLAARLDRLPQGKAVAQVGAVIGREFPPDLLAELTGQDPAALHAGIDQLKRAGLVVQRGPDARPTFQFRHALIQESAAGGLLKAERRRLNGHLVAVLETRFPETAQAEPERLARYAAEAGLTQQASLYWLKAGLQALGQSGMAEAIARLRAGLELAAALPAGEVRWRLELDLEVALGKAQIATIGYAPPATGETFRRAESLCAALGDTPQQLTVIHGQWTHDFIRGRLTPARARAESLLADGEAREDQLRIMMGCRMRGVTSYPLGEFETARACLERGLSLFDPIQRATYAQYTLDDARVVMLTYLAWVLSYLGLKEAALRRAEEAFAEAQAIAHPFSLAHALNGLAYTHLLDGRYDTALTWLDELDKLTAEHGVTFYAAIGQALRGRCLLGVGDAAGAAATLREALKAYKATDSQLYTPTFQTWLALALADEGRIAEGLRLTSSARSLVRKTGMAFDLAATFEVEAELHRLSGNLDAAAQRLEKAVAIAAGQKAAHIEARAREALARLRPAQPTVALGPREAVETR